MSPWQDERTRKDRANQPMNHLKAEMSNFSMNTACSFYQVCLHPSLRAHNYIKFRHRSRRWGWDGRWHGGNRGRRRILVIGGVNIALNLQCHPVLGIQHVALQCPRNKLNISKDISTIRHFRVNVFLCGYNTVFEVECSAIAKCSRSWALEE